MNGDKELAKQLTQLRLKRRLSQRQLAERIGITDRYIRSIENGTSMPSFGIVKNWFKATKATQESILMITSNKQQRAVQPRIITA
jgi:transcriptional regulator with XRE-family HTH domain